MTPKQVLQQHEQILDQIKELQEKHKKLFEDYFKSIGITTGTIFTFNDSYDGEHRCIAVTPTLFHYLTSKNKVNQKGMFKTLWAWALKDRCKIEIEKQLTEDEYKELLKR